MSVPHPAAADALAAGRVASPCGRCSGRLTLREGKSGTAQLTARRRTAFGCGGRCPQELRWRVRMTSYLEGIRFTIPVG